MQEVLVISQDHSHGSSQDLENTLTMHESDHEGHYREANLVDFVQSKLETPITIALLLASRVFSRAPLAHPCSSPCCTPPKRPFFFVIFSYILFVLKHIAHFGRNGGGEPQMAPQGAHARYSHALTSTPIVRCPCPFSLFCFLYLFPFRLATAVS